MSWTYAERCMCDGDGCQQFLECRTSNPLYRQDIAADLLVALKSKGWMVSSDDTTSLCPLHAQQYTSGVLE